MIWEERSPCSSPFLPAWKLQKRHTSCGGIPYFWIINIPHFEPRTNLQHPPVLQSHWGRFTITSPIHINPCVYIPMYCSFIAFIVGFPLNYISTVASWCQLMSLDVELHCLGILPYTKSWPIHPPTWLVQMVRQCLNPRRSWLKHHLLDGYPLNPQVYCLHHNYDCYMGNPNRLPMIIQHSNMKTHVYLGFIYKHLQMSHVP